MLVIVFQTHPFQSEVHDHFLYKYIEFNHFFLYIFMIQRRFQGGCRGVAPPSVKIRGVRGSPMLICLWINCWQQKNLPPPGRVWQKFTGGWQKISARFARYLQPTWPKRWNRPCYDVIILKNEYNHIYVLRTWD